MTSIDPVSKYHFTIDNLYIVFCLNCHRSLNEAQQLLFENGMPVLGGKNHVERRVESAAGQL